MNFRQVNHDLVDDIYEFPGSPEIDTFGQSRMEHGDVPSTSTSYGQGLHKSCSSVSIPERIDSHFSRSSSFSVRNISNSPPTKRIKTVRDLLTVPDDSQDYAAKINHHEEKKVPPLRMRIFLTKPPPEEKQKTCFVRKPDGIGLEEKGSQPLTRSRVKKTTAIGKCSIRESLVGQRNTTKRRTRGIVFGEVEASATSSNFGAQRVSSSSLLNCFAGRSSITITACSAGEFEDEEEIDDSQEDTNDGMENYCAINQQQRSSSTERANSEGGDPGTEGQRKSSSSSSLSSNSAPAFGNAKVVQLLSQNGLVQSVSLRDMIEENWVKLFIDQKRELLARARVNPGRFFGDPPSTFANMENNFEETNTNQEKAVKNSAPENALSKLAIEQDAHRRHLIAEHQFEKQRLFEFGQREYNRLVFASSNYGGNNCSDQKSAFGSGFFNYQNRGLSAVRMIRDLELYNCDEFTSSTTSLLTATLKAESNEELHKQLFTNKLTQLRVRLSHLAFTMRNRHIMEAQSLNACQIADWERVQNGINAASLPSVAVNKNNSNPDNNRIDGMPLTTMLLSDPILKSPFIIKVEETQFPFLFVPSHHNLDEGDVVTNPENHHLQPQPPSQTTTKTSEIINNQNNRPHPGGFLMTWDQHSRTLPLAPPQNQTLQAMVSSVEQ